MEKNCTPNLKLGSRHTGNLDPGSGWMDQKTDHFSASQLGPPGHRRCRQWSGWKAFGMHLATLGGWILTSLANMFVDLETLHWTVKTVLLVVEWDAVRWDILGWWFFSCFWASHLLENNIKVTKQSQHRWRLRYFHLTSTASALSRIFFPTQLNFICLAFASFFPKGLSAVAKPLLPLRQPDFHPPLEQHFEEAAAAAPFTLSLLCQLLRCWGNKKTLRGITRRGWLRCFFTTLSPQGTSRNNRVLARWFSWELHRDGSSNHSNLWLCHKTATFYMHLAIQHRHQELGRVQCRVPLPLIHAQGTPSWLQWLGAKLISFWLPIKIAKSPRVSFLEKKHSSRPLQLWNLCFVIILSCLAEASEALNPSECDKDGRCLLCYNQKQTRFEMEKKTQGYTGIKSLNPDLSLERSVRLMICPTMRPWPAHLVDLELKLVNQTRYSPRAKKGKKGLEEGIPPRDIEMGLMDFVLIKTFFL